MRRVITALAGTAFAGAASWLAGQNPELTPWRDDQANIGIVRQINRAYAHIPFSTEYEGVLDDCPFEIEWTVGPDIPYPWKGGISGVFGDKVVLAGGHWMGGKPHTYLFDPQARTYGEIAPYPVATGFSQGDADKDSLYLIGGKTAGQMAVKLNKTTAGDWQWSDLPPVPEANRWTSSVNVAGRWLLLYAGSFIDGGKHVALPAWRLRLDRLEDGWQPMAPYPGGERAVITSAVSGGKVYAFGGWRGDNSLETVSGELDLRKKYGFWIFPPDPAVQGFRDAYRYDPQTNHWEAIRNLPYSIFGGKGIPIGDRYILLTGTNSLRRCIRVGRSNPDAAPPYSSQCWLGYDDVILCYDIQKDNYSRVGVMLYGVSSWNWAHVGDQLFCFGGEPGHGLNDNRENVLQIGTIRERR
ncbi:MAG: Kelch repeat-containing protein [Acidobacteriota bacterium]